MATDQEIRDAGLLYIPKQKYLQDPYNLSTPPPPPPPDGGITNTNAFANSGNDGFSVYNPDPNSIVNRTYNPRPYYDATYEDTFGTNLGDPEALTATGARFAEPNTKMSGILNMMPGAGIARFLGNQIGPYIPPNRRAIMENQLSGQGIMVNDIGQIVQGDGAYDTAGNVMAGYNANKMTAKTFDDRIEMADNKMSAENKGARIKALKEAKAAWEKATGRSDTIYNFEEEEKKKNKKNTVINRFITDKKETKAAKDAQDIVDADAVKANIKKANQKGKNSPDNYGVQGLQRSGSYGGNDTYSGSGSTVSSSGDVTDNSGNYSGNINDEFAEGGRAGYFFGGRARLQGGGGADMGAPEKAAERASKGYGTAPDTGSKSGTNDYSTPTQDRNHDRAMRDYQKEKPSTLDNVMNVGSELSYLNNLKNLNVTGLALNFGVNKFRDYLKNKKLSEEDKLSYNTNPLPTNNYTTKLVGPALAQMRSLEKAKGMEQFGGPFSIEQGNTLDKLKQMDEEETIYSKPIKFTAANGGRAMFKNGGLASIL